ncbi:WAS/WASL-interacting protein family member 2 [Egretta garzetta]|uniref:WAS/WASL-interacting protein family member 2 n=1 Tax=Egretta garzetta TaxID=188379 RepID=UPI00163D1DC8|nr:WAS/WASL-interacting protein family member 2 [Egretta garzetta]
MPIPPPPPPPPGPPPPPTFSQANTEPPKLSREEQRGRGALLQDICKGTKLKKVTQINDRSAPILEKPKGSGGGSYGSSSAAIQPKGGLFQGGVPKLRPVGAKDSSGNGRLTAVCPIKPPPSPVSIRTGSGAQGQSLAPPPPPYRQPPGVPNGPSSPINESAPELPQRHNSLHRKTTGPLRGLAPPPPASASPSLQSSRPPPPARDPPSRGAAPPPPPPMLRNGGRDAPPPPPPYRLHGSAEPPSRGKPPPPPTRTPAGPPPPPPPVRNGHRDSISTVRAFLDDFESKYSFHPVEDFPAPEEYKYFQRIYPSKTNRATRGAPPLPPIPR